MKLKQLAEHCQQSKQRDNMRYIPLPIDTAKEVFEASISKVKNPALRARLKAVLPEVIAASAEFAIKASTTRLHTIDTEESVGSVLRQEMEVVYTSRMAKVGQPGRPFYDRLMSIPKNGCCPLCGRGRVTTLDHHLPNEKYPALVVAPLNLVPSCMDCNKVKHAGKPSCAEHETLHPYFDSVDYKVWLAARVIASSPTAIEFCVINNTGNGWPLMNQRIEKHFETFALNEVYASLAGEELANIRLEVMMVHGAAGTDGVIQHLLEKERTYRGNHRNTWQAAMYKALAENLTYCSGDFNI